MDGHHLLHHKSEKKKNTNDISNNEIMKFVIHKEKRKCDIIEKVSNQIP